MLDAVAPCFARLRSLFRVSSATGTVTGPVYEQNARSPWCRSLLRVSSATGTVTGPVYKQDARSPFPLDAASFDKCNSLMIN